MAGPRWLRKSLYETGERLQGVLLLFLQSRAEPAQTAKGALSLAADVYEREIITTHHLEQCCTPARTPATARSGVADDGPAVQSPRF